MEFVEVAGVRVPALGLGTWQLEGEDCRRSVAEALEMGYRHIDTAQMYDNEDRVGAGIADSGVDRADVWLTTKVNNNNHAAEDVLASVEHSLRRLQTDYVDLLLVHWPVEFERIEETLTAMGRLVDEGSVRFLGVSNFSSRQWGRAREIAPVICNQVEYHPYLGQKAVLEAVAADGGVVAAYSPLARGDVLKDTTLRTIGETHNKSAAQVTLRWLLDQPRVVTIPKATSRRHLEANLDVFDFTLSADERASIAALERGERIIDPPFGTDWD